MLLNLTKEEEKVFEWLATRILRIKSSFTRTQIADCVEIDDKVRVLNILKTLDEHPDITVFVNNLFAMGYFNGEPNFTISSDCRDSWENYKEEKAKVMCPKCELRLKKKTISYCSKCGYEMEIK